MKYQVVLNKATCKNMIVFLASHGLLVLYKFIIMVNHGKKSGICSKKGTVNTTLFLPNPSIQDNHEQQPGDILAGLEIKGVS